MKTRRWLVTFTNAVAVPINGGTVMTHCLVVEAPLENNEGKPPTEVQKHEEWNVARTHQMTAVSLGGDGRRFPAPLRCMIGGYNTISFSVELPEGDA